MAQIYLSGVGWLYSDFNASLSSNWTELDWTGTELGNMGVTFEKFRVGYGEIFF